MRKFLVGLSLLAFIAGTAQVSLAAGVASPQEAEAMVKKAVADIKSMGLEKVIAEASNPKGKYVDRDLYINIYDMQGKCLAHGANQKMIGKDFIAMRDTDGRPYIQERIELIQAKGKGWQNFKFTNPLTKKIEQKTFYVERVGDVIVGCGAYKK